MTIAGDRLEHRHPPFSASRTMRDSLTFARGCSEPGHEIWRVELRR